MRWRAAAPNRFCCQSALDVDPDEIVRLGGIRIRFIGPYPQAFIDIHKNSEKRSAGLHLDYSEIPTEMSRIIDWSDEERPADESGDLTQIMEISGKTIISLGEFLRLDRRSK